MPKGAGGGWPPYETAQGSADTGLLSRRRALRWGAVLAVGSWLPPARATTQMRVATLFQGATDTAVALGVTPCGVVESWSEKPVYRYLRPALAGVASLGLETQPSLEDLALLRPDRVIASRFRHARIAPLLERLCPVVLLDEVYEFKRTLRAMGEALQRQDQAAALLGQWDADVAVLRERLQAQYASHWPPTVAVLEIRADHVRSYLPGSFAGSVLSELGYAWPEASREAMGTSLKFTNRESLASLDADVFFVFQRADQPAVRRRYRELLAHPLWQRLKAPRTGQVWPVDGVAWSLAGGILGAQRMLADLRRSLEA